MRGYIDQLESRASDCRMSERYLREEFKKPEVSDIIIFKAPSFLQVSWEFMMTSLLKNLLYVDFMSWSQLILVHFSLAWQEFWFQWIDIPRISGMFGMFLVWNFCFAFCFFHGSSHTHRYIYILICRN
ncbi:hypothetical protein ACS0TY_025020 [Phlomoides rotata]